MAPPAAALPENMVHIAIEMVDQTLGGSTSTSSGEDGIQEVPSEAEPADIFAAARQGNSKQVRALIKSGHASAVGRDEQGLTPLHWAAGTGVSTQGDNEGGIGTRTLSTVPEEVQEEEQAMDIKVETCKYLIEQGADVNIFGGDIPATPLQWAARKGLVKIIDLLIQRGANPRLIDPQDSSLLHSVTYSSNFWAVLYIICQPDTDIDVKDHSGLTPLHWAARQGDEASTQILLKYGANPGAVDHDGFTALHWAASGGNKTCISLLLEAGADIQAKNKDQQTAQDMADSAVWDMVVGELGIESDGMRIRRPLSEPSVKAIIFLFPVISLCIYYAIGGVFSWVLTFFLVFPIHYVTIKVIKDELLRRGTINDSIDKSPLDLGTAISIPVSLAYMWAAWLQDVAPDDHVTGVALTLLVTLYVLALAIAAKCDPGICTSLTKDTLKPIIENLVRENRLNAEEFCIECMVVASPRIRHCSSCNKCIMYPKRMYGFDIVCSGHCKKMGNCIGSNNYRSCVVFVLSHGAIIPFLIRMVHICLHSLKGNSQADSDLIGAYIFLILTILLFAKELFLPIGKAIIYKVLSLLTLLLTYVGFLTPRGT